MNTCFYVLLLCYYHVINLKHNGNAIKLFNILVHDRYSYTSKHLKLETIPDFNRDFNKFCLKKYIFVDFS